MKLSQTEWQVHSLQWDILYAQYCYNIYSTLHFTLFLYFGFSFLDHVVDPSNDSTTAAPALAYATTLAHQMTVGKGNGDIPGRATVKLKFRKLVDDALFGTPERYAATMNAFIENVSSPVVQGHVRNYLKSLEAQKKKN